MYSLDHSWSSQASPVTARAGPDVTLPLTASAAGCSRARLPRRRPLREAALALEERRRVARTRDRARSRARDPRGSRRLRGRATSRRSHAAWSPRPLREIEPARAARWSWRRRPSADRRAPHARRGSGAARTRSGCLGDVRARAEERDLEPEVVAARRPQPARDVPPLGAKGRVAPWSRGKRARSPAHLGNHLARRRVREMRQGRSGVARKARRLTSPPSPRAHGPPIAWRPLATAVTVASATSTSANTASSSHGRMQVHAPVEGLAVHHVDQDQADHPAHDEPGRAERAEPALEASMAPTCRRVMPRWRSMPNSRRRASTIAPRLEDRPTSPTSTATSSSA